MNSLWKPLERKQFISYKTALCNRTCLSCCHWKAVEHQTVVPAVKEHAVLSSAQPGLHPYELVHRNTRSYRSTVDCWRSLEQVSVEQLTLLFRTRWEKKIYICEHPHLSIVFKEFQHLTFRFGQSFLLKCVSPPTLFLLCHSMSFPLAQTCHTQGLNIGQYNKYIIYIYQYHITLQVI